MPSQLVSYVPAGASGAVNQRRQGMPMAAALGDEQTIGMWVYDAGWKAAVSINGGTTWATSTALTTGDGAELSVWPDASGTGFWFASTFGYTGSCSATSTIANLPCCATANCTPSDRATWTTSSCNTNAPFYLYALRWTTAGFSAATYVTGGNNGSNYTNSKSGLQSSACPGSQSYTESFSDGYGSSGVHSMTGDTLCVYVDGASGHYTLSAGGSGAAITVSSGVGWQGYSYFSTMVDATNGIKWAIAQNGYALNVNRIEGAALSGAEPIDSGTTWAAGNPLVPIIYTGTALYAVAFASTTTLNLYKRANLTFGATQSWGLVQAFTVPSLKSGGAVVARSSQDGTGAMFASYISDAVNANGNVITIDLTLGTITTAFNNTSTQLIYGLSMAPGNTVPVAFTYYNGTAWRPAIYARYANPKDSGGRRGYREPLKGERGRGLYGSF